MTTIAQSSINRMEIGGTKKQTKATLYMRERATQNWLPEKDLSKSSRERTGLNMRVLEIK